LFAKGSSLVFGLHEGGLCAVDRATELSDVGLVNHKGQFFMVAAQVLDADSLLNSL
jgi:hypothetical protein